jgi:hypothetical protein
LQWILGWVYSLRAHDIKDKYGDQGFAFSSLLNGKIFQKVFKRISQVRKKKGPKEFSNFLLKLTEFIG